MKKILYTAVLLLLLASFTACIGQEKPPVHTSDAPVSSDIEPLNTTVPVPKQTTGPVETTAEPITTTVENPIVTRPAVTTNDPVATTPAETTASTPAETTAFDFAKSDLSEYILLGEYLGIEVFVSAPEEVSDAAIEERIEDTIAALPVEAMVYGRACTIGDKVNVDFAGSVDGDPVSGGSLEDYALVLGSEVTIPGFEEKIVGMIPGDTLSFSITFPEDYYVGLAGLTAEFTVTLNYIYPALTDTIASEYLQAESAAAYRESVRSEFEAQSLAKHEADKEDAAWTKALANSRILQYPWEKVSEAFESNVGVYTALAEMNGMTYEEFFPAFYGMSVADAEAIMMESSKNIVAQQLLLYAIALDMGIDISDETFEANLSTTAAILGYESVDILIEQLGRPKSALKEDKLYSQVITAIMTEANFVIIE